MEIDKRDIELLKQIYRVIHSGNKAEVEQGRDGIKVLEVKRRPIYKENNEQVT